MPTRNVLPVRDGARVAQKRSSPAGEMKGEYVEEAMISTAKAGRCVVTAMGHLIGMDVKLNLFLTSMLQKDLRDTIFGGGSVCRYRRWRQRVPKVLSMYRVGTLELDAMITRTYSLDDVNDGYQDMLDGKNIRGVIRYTEADW
ncbi:Zn-dependent alcohol dehydrogenase [Rhodococcus sp. 27YEA15]|uniref:hypothetical protein n=1 Tax=Rhodococcus sp. 27YEA15 TaxID=3156259 RepID=UPI003C7CBC16